MHDERHSKEALVAELLEAGGGVQGNAVRCPFHQDHHASGGLYEKDGIWRYQCHSTGCGFSGDVFDVRAKRTGQPLGDLLPREGGEVARPPQHRQDPPKVYSTLDEMAATFGDRFQQRYVYTDPATERADLIVFRYRRNGGKAFAQAHPVVGGFAFGAPEKPWPVYNRARLRAAESVVVVEGEKCVHALHEVGIIATTSPCGAGKAQHADWGPLAGRKVCLWPDNDEAGAKHMDDVERCLEQLDPAPTVSRLDPAGLALPCKGDVVDLLALVDADEDTTRAAVEVILEDAAPVGASREVGELLEATISGERRAIPWPWPRLGDLTKALLPGTITLLCGGPGVVKSLAMLQAAAFWHAKGIKVAMFQLEDDRDFALYRVLAQRVGDSALLDDEHVAAHPDQVRAAFAEHRDFLDGFGRCIWDAPDRQPTLEDLAKWTRERCQAGARVVVIDPVSVAARGQQPWEDDTRFLVAVKGVVREHGASLVLVTHPRKGQQGPGLDELAGGAAYQRLSQTVLWLERFKQTKAVSVASMGGFIDVRCNRTLHICKARNGKGHGARLAVHFDGRTLQLEERGIIRDADK